MAETGDPRYAMLCETRRAEFVPAIEGALERAGIPYRTGLQVGSRPSIVFTVAESRLDEARGVVERAVDLDHEAEPRVEADEEQAWETARAEEERERRRATFPRGAVAATGGLVLLHLWIVLGLVGSSPSAAHLVSLGGLVRSAEGIEWWRLVTSLFLHSDLAHVAWNGLALVVFGVPAILSRGYVKSALVYVLAGICGGLAAVVAHPVGTVIVGSSGAVSGLFGAWLVTMAERARRSPMTRRAWIRAVGLALLVLPSLLNPVSSEGHPISVAAHLGGLACGAALGWGHSVFSFNSSAASKRAFKT